MNYILNNYKPIEPFHYFEELSAIPRGSGNESGVAAYLCEFAKKHGLSCYSDKLGNTLICKGASKGMEKSPTVILQAHTDMVCEMNAGTKHDFQKDGIELIEKNGRLSANGTTLGGDDGAGVALMLWVLSDENIAHPPLECLFTVQEEVGLCGAFGFNYSRISGRRIINLDTEDEGIAVASCAGSMNICFTLNGETVPFANQALKISIKGLAGGHSGTDINSGVMNSNLLMGRILSSLYDKEEFNLVSVSGGNKRNAIPRECEAIISVRSRDDAIAEILKTENEITAELCKKDRKGFKVHVSRTGKKEEMFTFADTSKALSLLSLVPNGVISMSQSMEGLVESSSNLGVVETEEKSVKFYAYARSSVDSVMDNIYIKMKRLAKLTGMDIEQLDRCPGWAFVKNTELQSHYIKCYEKLFPEMPKPRVEAIHAGLECGIILEKIGGGDAIAIGPSMSGIHTPDETLDLHSVERTAALLAEMLKNM